MSISSKILTAVALAVALSPLAAQARSDHPPGPAKYYLAPLHQDQVMTGSATMGGNRASANYGGQYAPNAVASAVPTQNGFAGEGYGANSAGGGNRASADYGGQYAPNVVASPVPTQNGFAGEGYGANSAGGGNRASADYGGQYAPNAVASAVPTQNGFAGEGYGANSAGGGNR